ncbi:MAG TPA: hypothetical protein VGF08_07845, partial [Terriglobales bacterium]
MWTGGEIKIPPKERKAPYATNPKNPAAQNFTVVVITTMLTIRSSQPMTIRCKFPGILIKAQPAMNVT